MQKVVVRVATKADIEAFSDMAGKPTLKAWVGEVDGEIVAIGGFARDRGRYFAFCDLKPEARAHKMHIMRWAKRIMGEAHAMGIRYVYADAEIGEPKARAWLASLGFRLDPRSKLYYRWDRKEWQP